MTDHAKYYKFLCLSQSVPAVKQQQPNWCWAACMEWWSQAMKGGRPALSQAAIFNTFKTQAESDGSISVLNLATVLRTASWRANVDVIQAHASEGVCLPAAPGLKLLMTRLASGPVILGYYHLAVSARGAHAIVVVAPSSSYEGEFVIMEPDRGAFTHRKYSLLRSVGCNPIVLASPRT